MMFLDCLLYKGPPSYVRVTSTMALLASGMMMGVIMMIFRNEGAEAKIACKVKMGKSTMTLANRGADRCSWNGDDEVTFSTIEGSCMNYFKQPGGQNKDDYENPIIEEEAAPLYVKQCKKGFAMTGEDRNGRQVMNCVQCPSTLWDMLQEDREKFRVDCKAPNAYAQLKQCSWMPAEEICLCVGERMHPASMTGMFDESMKKNAMVGNAGSKNKDKQGEKKSTRQ